jgi:5-carboxyvanillate decarboxylase
MFSQLIDLEAHFFTKSYLDYLRRNDEYPRLEPVVVDGVQKERMVLGDGLSALREKTLAALLDMEDERLKQMDAAGVAMQALSLAGPGCEMFRPEDAVSLVRDINDEIAAFIGQYPDRFFGLAALAPQDPNAAVKELERSVTELGFKGAKFNSHFRGGEYVDEKKYRGLLECAASLDVPLYLHPRTPSEQMIKPFADYGFRLAGPTLGFAVDTALASMRLTYAGVFDRFPDLKIVLGHLGEALPFWVHRVNHLWNTEEGGLTIPLERKPSEYIKNNFWVTTSGMMFLPAFLCTYLALGADRIMFAVDYPFESTLEAAQFATNLPVSDEDKEKILRRNAETLFKL